MFSRLSAFAALFAVITTTSLAYAATVQQHQREAANTPVVMLERVVIVGTHTPATSN